MDRDTEKSMMPEASDLNHKSYVEGDKHYKKKNYKRARQAFEVSLEYWPEDPQAWFALGNCFDELNKPKKAEKCFRTALLYMQDEESSDVYFNLGNSLYDQGKLVEAIKFYKMVSGQSSSYWYAQRNLKRANNEL